MSITLSQIVTLSEFAYLPDNESPAFLFLIRELEVLPIISSS